MHIFMFLFCLPIGKEDCLVKLYESKEQAQIAEKGGLNLFYILFIHIQRELILGILRSALFILFGYLTLLMGEDCEPTPQGNLL